LAVPELSPIEKRIVVLVAAGRSMREIAVEAGLDERTVDWHLARARRKLEQIAGLQRCVDGAIREARDASAEGSNERAPCPERSSP
jgi:FixJ family two-component response regulator